MNKEFEATPEILVERLRAGEKLRPVRWKNAELLNNGHCEIERLHTFVEHTPKTVGVKTSPAIAGAREAIEKYGSTWEPAPQQ